MMALPSPEADPARCGRTDRRPEVALGIVMPFPSPTKVQKPKKIQGEPRPASVIRIAMPSPTTVTTEP